MATYYADFDLATGNNDGTSWADAWQTMADAIAGTNGTPPAAGDTVYCRGTDTLSASPTLTQSGGGSTGRIRWIGVNGSGTNDGTRVVLDANGARHALTLSGDHHLFENFAFTGTTGSYDGLWGAGDYNVFVNCAAYSCGDCGFGSLGTNNILIRCVAYSNGGYGIYGSTTTQCFFCCSHDNTSRGFYLTTNSLSIACLSYDNGSSGFDNLTINSVLFNCVSDRNGVNGINMAGYHATVIGCRVTSHDGGGQIGLDYNNLTGLHGWNYFEDNDGDNIQADGYADEIREDGASTDQEDQADTNEGYTDKTDGAEDYNLRSDATLRRTAIQIPLS